MSMFGGDDELVIHARVDNDASPELRDVREELRGVATQAATTGRTASRTSRDWNVMGRAAKAAAFGAKLAFGAALAGGYALVRLLKSSFAEAREAQKVGATTAAIIKSTGGAAKVTERQVARLAGRLSEMAGIDDELIQTGANLLLTFKQIRNEQGKGNRIFDRATTAAVNLAAAGFGSVESGAKMLGKALNDPLKGITALSRAGVTFTQQQQDQIKTLVEQGDLLTAQKIILGEVESQVGGVAKAQATWGDKARVVYDNILERLGTALLPMLDDLNRWFVQTGGPALDRYVGIFERRGVPAIRDFVDDVKPLAREYLPELWSVLKDVWGVVRNMAPVVGDLLKGFNDLPAPLKSAILVAAGTASIARKLNSSTGVIGSIATKARPLPVWVVNNTGGVLGGGKNGGPGAVVTGGGPKGTTTAPKGGKLGKLARGAGVPGAILTALSFSDTVQGILADPWSEAKNELLWPWKEGPFAPEKTTQAERQIKNMWDSINRNSVDGSLALERLLIDPMNGARTSTDKWRTTFTTALEDGRTKAQNLGGVLGQLNMDRERASVQRWHDTFTSAVGDSGDKLIGLLAQIDRLNNMGTPSVPTPTPSSGGSSGGNKWEDLYSTGKSGKGGERVAPRAAPSSTERRAGVTVENLHVDARGANTELDVVEATGRALDDYFRDREERA